MTQLFVQIAQSVTGAVIAIVGLLLAAGIIGYVTAWFYARSVYTPVIKGLRSEKEELTRKVEDLNRQVEVMKSEIIKLNETIESQGEKIKTLEQQIAEKEKEIKKITKPLKEN
jgi:septal ring factor EnvC (AmiA/AmiB activator)